MLVKVVTKPSEFVPVELHLTVQTAGELQALKTLARRSSEVAVQLYEPGTESLDTLRDLLIDLDHVLEKL